MVTEAKLADAGLVEEQPLPAMNPANNTVTKKLLNSFDSVVFLIIVEISRFSTVPQVLIRAIQPEKK